jgi:hypothetical protein
MLSFCFLCEGVFVFWGILGGWVSRGGAVWCVSSPINAMRLLVVPGWRSP